MPFLASPSRLGLAAGKQAPSGGLISCGPDGAGAAQVSGRLSLAPVFVPAGATITEVWFGQTAAGVAPSFFRPVIFSCDPTSWVPGSLLVDVGQFDTSGANGDKSVALPTALTFGADTLLFVGGAGQGTNMPSIRQVLQAGGVIDWAFPYQSFARSLGTPLPFFRQDGVAGAPAAAWPAVDYSNLAMLTGTCPWVGLRVQ